MRKNTALRRTALLAVSGALMAMGAQVPAHAQSMPFQATCQDIHNLMPSAPDGDYILYNNGTLLTVYCADMATAPAEYVNLASTGPNANFSQYTAGGASPGTNVRTRFTKLRINPATLQVDIGDLTFASSTGSLLHAGSIRVTSMPYGVAMACVAPFNAAGVGNIDLTGTAFQVTSTFAASGSRASGSATISPGNQVVSLTGGGFCGWEMTAPPLFNPFNPSPGMYNLQLACGDSRIVNGNVCLTIPSPLEDLTLRAGQLHGRSATTVRYHGRVVAVTGKGGRVLS